MAECNEENLKDIFITQLNDFLFNNKPDMVFNLFKDNTYENVIDQYSWDIVPILSSYLTNENQTKREKLFHSCVNALNIIAEKCKPAETVLLLLEQAEYLTDDTKFCVILNILNKCFYQMKDKMEGIEWCVSTIRLYVQCLPTPENEKAELDENISLKDIDSVVLRLVNLNWAIVSFIERLVEETLITQSYHQMMYNKYLLNLLIYLLGKPFCCIHNYYFELIKPEQSIAKKIIMLTSCLTSDLLHPLNFIDEYIQRPTKHLMKNTYQKSEGNSEATLSYLDENMSNLSYANYYYYIITTSSIWKKVPQVYNPHFILHVCIYFVNSFLQEEGRIFISRGLHFFEHVLQFIEKHSISSHVLEFNAYSEILNNLAKIMIFCDSEENRKTGLRVFLEYIELFDMQARYFIVLYLYETCTHSGLMSLVTSIFKSSIIECLSTQPPRHEFTGKNMEILLKKACKLSHGSDSDLVEISDEVITTLNLLRFLFIRDQHNDTGIWNLINMIETSYLKPLTQGINKCKNHWKIKAMDLKEDKYSHNDTNNKITLTVGGEILPPMPNFEKIKFCQQAINGLDVMESILVRVNECIANNPLQSNLKNNFKKMKETL